jgi:hypothetical protein
MSTMSDPETQLRISECGKALAIASVKAMSIDGSVNLPTLVAACARMSGSYLLRSFGLDLSSAQPGQAVLSQQVSAANPHLLHLSRLIMESLGTTIANSPTTPLDEQRKNIKQDFLESLRTLEPIFAPLQAKYSLNEEQMSKAGAVAAGILVHQFSKHMEANLGLGYAALGFAEGSQTIPLRLEVRKSES